MSPEWEQLPLPGEVREGYLEEEQGVGLLKVSHLATSIPTGCPL